MTLPNTPPSGQPDPAALLALGLATQAAGADASSAPPLTPAELAAEFPQLEILELLGRGGMGAVYKARQRDLDRLVALKILRPGLDADPGFAERFTREARALAQLNHPGIVTLYEFGKTSAGRYFILMEFVDGMNLRQLLAAGRLSPREALAIVPPLCDALQYAHDRGLIHRDIKPENLLIDRLGRIKIADFGIAKITTTDAASTIGHWSLNIGPSGEGAGTPHYMAPEQRTHPDTVDHRADLYALGVVFYQMLTGELPSADQLRPPSTRVQLDVRLDEIVLRALDKDPARRYAAATDFKTHVETVANTSAPVSSAASISTDNGVSYRSRRTLLGLPLLHVATGVDPVTGKRRIARGIVAIGDHAQGVFAFGGVAVGGVSFGGVSLGLFSYGGLALGLLVHGGLGIGALASFAGLALAPIALGGSALGWYAYGGAAWGRHVNSPSRHDPAAVDFFGTWAREFTQIGGTVTSLLFVAGFALMIFAITWARKRAAGGAAPNRTANSAASSPPLLPASVLVLFLVCFCGSLRFAAENFPHRVAVHFNMTGHADGWAERGVALLVFLVVGVGISFFIPCLFALLRFLPSEFINLPHQGFWLAPQRAASTHARLLRAGFWIAALNAAFFWGLQILSHWAHLSTPPRLPMAALWILTGLFLAAIILWILRLIRAFSRTELAANPPAPSRLSRALRPAAPWLLLFLIFIGILVPVGTALDILRSHQVVNSPPAIDEKLNNSLIEQPVTLRAINWFDKAEARLSSAWLPDGSDLPTDEKLFPVPKASPTTNPNLRYLCFWFSHPLVDLLSVAEVKLFAPLDPKNGPEFDPDKSRPLIFEQGSSSRTTIPAKAPHLTEGWWVFTTNLDTSQALPADVIVRLRYSLGPWRTWEHVNVADFRAPRVLDYDITLGIPAEDPKNARPYVEIRSTLREHGILEQWDVVALTRDGQRLERYGTNRTTEGKEHVERLYFNAPLSQLRALEIRKRPIRTHTWKAALKNDAHPAVAIAHAWLRNIDQGEYSESWRKSAALFQNSITEDAWITALNTVRSPLKKAYLRHLQSATEATRLPGIPDGRYVVLQFTTQFSVKDDAIETLTLSQEPDGIWRPIGYFIK